MYKLNGATGDSKGLGIAIKVMAGDNVNIYAKSFWHGSGPTNSYPPVVNDLLTILANTSAVTSAYHGTVTASALTGSAVTPSEVSSFLSSAPTVSGRPNAYLNWILFDEQFRPVSASSGFDAVNTSADVLKTHSPSVSISKSGTLYIYVSNSSDKDVFFDNLQVIHTRGSLLEENHYYPFGLTMAGISSKAAGKLENRYKYNGIELDTTFGVDVDEAFFRDLDHQTGRWWQVDPKIELDMENWSPYASNFDNPIRYSDPKGDCPTCKEIWKDIKDAVKETAKSAYNGAVSIATAVNQNNPLANLAEALTGKSVQSGFTESKPRAQAVADLGVNTVMLFGGEAFNAFRGEAAATNVATRSAAPAATEEVLSGKAGEFTRLETIGGNQSSRTVGANIKLINSGQELAPIKVAEINGKKYVLDGHHRLEAASRTGTELRYEVVPESGYKGYNYTKSEILNSAANASAEKVKLNGKIVNQYAQQ